VVRAALQRREGALGEAIETLRQAWEQAPNDHDVQDELVSALAERIGQLMSSGAAAEQTAVMESWRQRFGGHPTMSARLDTLYWSSLVKHYLDQTDLKYRRSTRHVFFLPFDSPVVGALVVRLAVERDTACLVGGLPPVADADDPLTLGNLLEAASELTFFRPAEVEAIGLALLCRLPLRYLTPEWVTFLVRGMALFADVQPAFLRNLGQLRAHLQFQRDIVRLIRPGGWNSLAALAELCAARRLEHAAQNHDHHRIRSPQGDIEVAAVDEGVRLAMDLGYLRSAADRGASLRQMVAQNYRLGVGKLGISDRGRVMLICELPHLDEAGFGDALDLFAAHGERLRRELTQD
jgi:hypothetical protein